MRSLIINPGSTSTKISVFDGYEEIFTKSVFHDAPQLVAFGNVNNQVPFRKDVILETLRENGFDINDIDVFVGRGGSAYPQHSGVLRIDDRLYKDTLDGAGGSEHPAKLGVLLAYELCKEYGGEMYTLNATNVDELNDLARLTGIKGVYRNAQSHVLNQKAVAMHYAQSIGMRYEDLDLIVCHIDGGITVNAHCHGRMTDGNVGSGGDGAFTPTRLGSVPVLPLLDYIESHSVDEVRTMCSRSGGFVQYFGTSNSDTVHRLAEEGDDTATLVWNTMIYDICKQIGAMSTVLKGKVDAILLTGGLVRFSDIPEGISERCGWIAPIHCYPGEMEQEAMAHAVMRVKEGKEQASEYTGRPVWNGFPSID